MLYFFTFIFVGFFVLTPTFIIEPFNISFIFSVYPNYWQRAILKYRKTRSNFVATHNISYNPWQSKRL